MIKNGTVIVNLYASLIRIKDILTGKSVISL